VSETRASACWYGCPDQALKRAPTARKRCRLASVDRKGDNPALSGPGAAASWPLRLFGATSLPPGAVPTPSLGCREGNGRTASVARPQPCSPQDRRLHCWSTNGIERAASAALGLKWARRGARAGARHLGDSPRPPAQWAPAQGPPLIACPGSLRSAHSERPPGLASARSGWASALSRLLESRCGDPTHGGCDGQLTQDTATLWPQALDLQQGPDVPWSLRRQRHLRMAGPALELWLQREDGQQTGLQPCTPASALQSWRRPGRGAR